MALLGEKVVEEWLNRQGYFTIRGIRLGVQEIDLLAFSPHDKRPPQCRHVEVQVSTNPISYISKVPKETQRARHIGPDNAAKRTVAELRQGIAEWIAKKFGHPKKVELLNRLFPGEWSRELVVNAVKHPDELDMFREAGITVLHLKDIVDDLAHTDTLIQAAAGNDLFNLMQLGRAEKPREGNTLISGS